MPLPKALQAALDSTPAPDQTSNVFDFEAANRVVSPAAPDPDFNSSPTDDDADNWLEGLMLDEDTGDITPADGDAADFLTDDSTGDGELSLPDMGNSDMSDLKEVIASLEQKINKGEAETAQQAALEAARVQLREKYGEADEDLLENFSDLFSTFRAQFGSEFGEEIIKAQTDSDAKIKILEDKIEALTNGGQVIQNTDSKSPNDYRDFMAGAIPDYSKIIGSTKFKRLMAMPIDADNPEFTYNKKLGKLYGQRKTAEIMKFFSSFTGKYMSDGSGGAVVDSGSSSPSQGGKSASLSPDRLRSIFKKVMSGELKLSEAEMSKLRKMAARQAMK